MAEQKRRHFAIAADPLDGMNLATIEAFVKHARKHGVPDGALVVIEDDRPRGGRERVVVTWAEEA